MDNLISKKEAPFHFKKFSVLHHNSTMKVGTDAILLGAWCDAQGANNILDVGTGCGVIALILATRINGNIDAVELDENSIVEASFNFAAYKTNPPLIYQNDFINFVNIINKKYELIVTNPPFFSNSLLPENKLRKVARHTQNLNHFQLCKGVASLLSNQGKFCVVLPYNIANNFIRTAKIFKLHLHKQQIIYPKPSTLPNRVNMEFRFSKSKTIITESMVIRENNGEHTEQYKNYVSNYLTRI